MINEDRVRLMTKLSLYERKSGKADRMDNYFKTDYISMQCLGTFITSTLAYLLLLVLYAFYHIEVIVTMIFDSDSSADVGGVIIRYILFVAVSEVLTVLIYRHRYQQMRKDRSEYYRDLKRLEESYQRDNEART